MSVLRYVLDTNIISAVIKREPDVSRRIEQALRNNVEFLLCPVVFYEIYRGFLYHDAGKQLNFFLRYTSTFTWDDLKRDDWEQAGQLWARLRKTGSHIDEPDLLIGTYAIRRRAIMVTDNEKDFVSLGVSVENWRR